MSAAVLEVRVHAGRVRVEIGGYVLADSDAVLEVREQGHDPVLYFPPQVSPHGPLAAERDHHLLPSQGTGELLLHRGRQLL